MLDVNSDMETVLVRMYVRFGRNNLHDLLSGLEKCFAGSRKLRDSARIVVNPNIHPALMLGPANFLLEINHILFQNSVCLGSKESSHRMFMRAFLT